MPNLSTHRIRLVTGPALQLNCVGCGTGLQLNSRTRERAYADLDGKPFVDYYCRPCAMALGATIDDMKGDI